MGGSGRWNKSAYWEIAEWKLGLKSLFYRTVTNKRLGFLHIGFAAHKIPSVLSFYCEKPHSKIMNFHEVFQLVAPTLLSVAVGCDVPLLWHYQNSCLITSVNGFPLKNNVLNFRNSQNRVKVLITTVGLFNDGLWCVVSLDGHVFLLVELKLT